MIPRLFKDMPKKEGGRWMAVVIRTSAFRGSREVRAVRVTGLRRAYFVARILALLEDLLTPHYNGEVGINWAVRSAELK